MAGFTLVETLIALSIFALIALGGVALLNITITSQERLDVASSQTRELQRLQAVLRADIGQMVERVNRTQTGNFDVPLRAANGDALLQFATLGRLVDPDDPQPTLQKVRYWVQDGALRRSVFSHADGAKAPRPMTVLNDVTNAKVAVFNDRNWAPLKGGAAAMPRAIELHLNHRTLGQIKLRYLTPQQGEGLLNQQEALF